MVSKNRANLKFLFLGLIHPFHCEFCTSLRRRNESRLEYQVSLNNAKRFADFIERLHPRYLNISFTNTNKNIHAFENRFVSEDIPNVDKKYSVCCSVTILTDGYNVRNTWIFAVSSLNFFVTFVDNRAKAIWERLRSVKENSSFEIAALYSSPYRGRKSAKISKQE